MCARPTRRVRRADTDSESTGSDPDFIPPIAAADSCDSVEEVEIDIRGARSPSHQARNPTKVLAYAALAFVAAGAALAMLTVALNVGIFAVGALNPAWQTFRALEGRVAPSTAARSAPTEVEEVVEGTGGGAGPAPTASHMRNWAAYWVSAAGLFSMEGLLLRPTLGSVVPSPLYPALRFATLVYLTGNNAEKSGAMYDDIVRPGLIRIEGSVERYSRVLTDAAAEVMGAAVVGFHEFVEPYALQLRHAAAQSARRLHSEPSAPHRYPTRGRRSRR